MAETGPKQRRRAQQGRSPKERAQDDLVMSTNSSSIVSKRSVERIYYPNEPHFFRFFVKKFQKRAPLINRGYHLRLHVIDVAVRDFLKRPSSKTKVVINLGAGFDVLPWQCLTRYPDHCRGVKFVDVDFPDLMAKKRSIVCQTPELNSVLTNMRTSDGSGLNLESDQYVQIACDLRQLQEIERSLSKVISISDSEFMFVAEVSITYMETSSADAVIKWASSLGKAEFCLLEQILPDGADHPFADTMLQHFEKLKTNLKSVHSYPTLQAQEQRFASLGWPHVDAKSLWYAWSSAEYLSAGDKRKLNETEPFDEWEEFAIFGGHYCVVRSSTEASQPQEALRQDDDPVDIETLPRLSVVAGFNGHGKSCQRRFGAPMVLQSYLGERLVVNTLGLGNTSRLRSLDLYVPGTFRTDFEIASTGPPSRMCHAIVDLGCHGNLLIGGRSSPSSAMKDCWLFDKVRKVWQKAEDLPTPLYRHSATRLGGSSLALVIGGKTGASAVFDGCLLYHPEKGWIECELSGSSYIPIFGATLASSRSNPSDISVPGVPFTFQGILAGGLSENGTFTGQMLRWKLTLRDIGRPIVKFNPCGGKQWPTTLLDRFGASAIINQAGHLVLVGGVVANRVLPSELEVLLVDISNSNVSILAAGPIAQSHKPDTPSIPRPLLVGLSVAQAADGSIVTTGGGATCFSMGSYWNKGCYTLRYQQTQHQPVASPESSTNYSFHRTFEHTDCSVSQPNSLTKENASKPVIVAIPRVRLSSSAKFADITKAGRPVVIEGVSLGSCVRTWTPDHLVAKVGADRKVVVHEAETAKLDFNAKNFTYVTKDFGPFIEEVQNGGKMYMRALSEERATERPANIKQDFPTLAEEFSLPEELSSVTENLFSSILRITGPVNMWLHYDVMANIYCQIVGSKRMILFPPADISTLPLSPGASSSSLDVFGTLEKPLLAGTHPHEAILNSGDLLFLPPLWLHTASPTTNLGVAVNLFFRNLESGYAAGRDVYGNRDLAAYERGRQEVSRIISAFDKVPSEMREFYVKRLADELLQKLYA